MIDIYEVKLLDLLPPNLRHDPDIIAASKAVDDEFLLVVNEAKHCIIMPRIDELESDLVDLLAWERHVDFYDTSLPLEIRRTLVKNSIRWHKRKGTPAAVEEIVTEIFGKGQVEEWFEYGGVPYSFRINIEVEDQEITEEALARMDSLVNKTKNARSWLEVINIYLISRLRMFLACNTASTEEITVYPEIKTNIESAAKMRLASAIIISDDVKIYPYIKQNLASMGSIKAAIGNNNTEEITIYPRKEVN